MNIQVSTSKKSSERVGVLLRLGNLVPTQSKLQLYKATILPYLTYRHLMWYFCRANALLETLRVSNKEHRGLHVVINIWSYGPAITIYVRAIYSTKPATTGHSYPHV